MTKRTEMRARCDERYIQALEEVANIEGVDRAEALRLIVRDAAKQYGVWPLRYDARARADAGHQVQVQEST